MCNLQSWDRSYYQQYPNKITLSGEIDPGIAVDNSYECISYFFNVIHAPNYVKSYPLPDIFNTNFSDHLQNIQLYCKVLSVDFREEKLRIYEPLFINRMIVERVNSFRFLEVHIPEDLYWAQHSTSGHVFKITLIDRSSSEACNVKYMLRHSP